MMRGDPRHIFLSSLSDATDRPFFTLAGHKAIDLHQSHLDSNRKPSKRHENMYHQKVGMGIFQVLYSKKLHHIHYI
jgi:hypothetical protein